MFNERYGYSDDEKHKQSSRLILAHRRTDVAKLNQTVRAKLLTESLI